MSTDVVVRQFSESEIQTIIKKGKGITSNVEIVDHGKFIELYKKHKLSCASIGKLLGISKKTVRLKLIDLGVKLRDLKKARQRIKKG